MCPKDRERQIREAGAVVCYVVCLALKLDRFALSQNNIPARAISRQICPVRVRVRDAVVLCTKLNLFLSGLT